MFKAREKFNKEDLLPRKMIHFWSERNMFIVLFIFVFCMIVLEMIKISLDDDFDMSYLSIQNMLDDDGLF
jgi:p-aminobenzoyl-glutamate transporter AbgT